jgi:uncharacterized protein (DUF697 family)
VEFDQDDLKRQFEKAIKGKESKGEQADAVVFVSVGLSSAMGFAPFGLNILVWLALNAGMLAFLGQIYGYFVSLEDAGKLVQRILLSGGFTYAISILGFKIVNELVKVLGVTTAGAATAVAMGVDGVLLGALTFAIGFTGKDYFASGKGLTDKQIASKFKDFFKKGKK